MRLRLAPLLLLGLLVASYCDAATYYVATTGNDSNSCATAQTCTSSSCTTAKKHFGTASGAMKCAAAGDTVDVRAGDYNETFATATFSPASGTAGNEITLQAHTGETVWLKPSASCNVVNFAGPAYWTIDGINVDGHNMNCGGGTANSYSLNAPSSHLTLKNLTVLDTASVGGVGTAIASHIDYLHVLNVTVNGTHSTYPDYNGEHCFYVADPGNNGIIENSTIFNCGGAGIQLNSAALTRPPSTGWVLRNNNIYNFGRRTTGSGRNGIVLNTNQQSHQVYNNLVSSSASSCGFNTCLGISSYGTLNQDNQIYNNTIVGNVAYCMAIGAFNAALRTLVKNNICKDNGLGIIIYASAHDTVLDHNLMHNSGSVSDSGVNTTNTNLITTDPLLVDIASRDFHLGASSGARNAGVTLAVVLTDFDGVARPQGGVYDIGAFEYIESGGVPGAFHVAKTGNDSNTCIQASAVPPVPKLTIASGLTCLTVAGSSLLIHAGTYTESVDTNTATLTGGSSWDVPTVIAAFPGDAVTLQSPGGANVALFWFRNASQDHYVIIDHLTLDGNSCTGCNGLVYYPGVHHMRYQFGEIKNTHYEPVYIKAADNTEVLTSVIHDNATLDGIGVVQASDATILMGNTIYNIPESGIRANADNYPTGTNTNSVITANTIYNTGTGTAVPALTVGAGSGALVANNLVYGNNAGIAVFTNMSGAKIYNNTSTGNTNIGLDVRSGASSTLVKNNIVYNNGSAIVDNGTSTTQATNFTTNPLFVDTSGNDYRLQAGSPARDAGTTLSEVPVDIRGVARPVGLAYDIGAFEQVISTPFAFAGDRVW